MKFLLFFFSLELCFALPKFPVIEKGWAHLDYLSDKELTITADANTVINWQQFSIEKEERVTFLLPGQGSAVLNRVVGMLPSKIDSCLEANGSVFLINPQGINFEKAATVNVASLFVSSLDMDNEAFLQKEEVALFRGSLQPLVNEGNIYTYDGNLFLIGHQIENEGSIRVDNGNAYLIAADELELFYQRIDTLRLRLDRSQARIHKFELHQK